MKASLKRGWTKPAVTRVKLDPRQAVMRVCIANYGYGAWMEAEGALCGFGTTPGTYFSCEEDPRGSFGNGRQTFDAENAGS